MEQLNRVERRQRVLERDGGRCVWCRREVGGRLVRATTEHLVPRVKGGPSWIENELVACTRCNRRRGHASPAAWIEECRLHGWEPDEDAVVRGLVALQETIRRRGGQRRARAYVRSQLRRLAPARSGATAPDGGAVGRGTAGQATPPGRPVQRSTAS